MNGLLSTLGMIAAAIFKLQLKKQSRQYFHLFYSPSFKHACSSPITAIAFSLDTIVSSQQFNQLSPTVKESIKIAVASSNRLQSLFQIDAVNDERRTVYLRSTIREVIFQFQRFHPQIKVLSDIRISAHFKLQIDKFYFQEALLCILNNAVESWNHESQAKALVILCHVTKSCCKIEFIDSGKGMSSLQKKMAFIQGISFKSQNSGLGLAFVEYTISKLMKGKVVISSEPGVGTRVICRFPLTESTDNQSHEQS